MKTYSRKRMRTVHMLSESTPSPPSDDPTARAVKPAQMAVQGLNQHVTPARNCVLKSASPRPRKRLKTGWEETTSESSKISDKSTSLASANAPRSPSRRLEPTCLYDKAKFKVFTAKRLTSPNRNFGGIKSSEYMQQSQVKSGIATSAQLIRTRSQTLKENILLNPLVLGPPIRILPPKRVTDQKHPSFTRRPSADIHNVIPTSASFHRRPTGSHALQKKSQNQDWLAPVASCPAASRFQMKKTSDTPIFANDSHIARTHMLFRPQFFSTPLHTRFISHSTSPSTPTTPIAKPNRSSPHTMMKDITLDNKRPVCKAQKLGVRQAVQPAKFFGTPRRMVHLSQDSIFSSFDVSAPGSLQISDPGDYNPITDALTSNVLRQNESVVNKEATMKIEEPENVKLHNMFSGLGLTDGKAKTMLTFQDSGIAIDTPIIENGSKNKTEGENNRRGKRLKFSLMAQGEKKTLKGKHHSKKGRTDKGRTPNPTSLPKAVLTMNDDPLIGNVDEDDELLLTSKGWDWDPRTCREIE